MKPVLRISHRVNLSLAFIASFAIPLSAIASDALTIERVAPTLQQHACASEGASIATELTLSITPVDLGETEEIAKALPPKVSFLGGWHLTHTNPHFGGFSGLTATEDGSLLAVSDKGYFLSLEMNDGAPEAKATLFPMLTQSGHPFSGKKRADAEGLAYKDGIAYVSFEHQHRIQAFDIARCGALATAVTIASLPDKIGKKSIKPNNGAEALHINSQGAFIAGYETVIKNKSPRVTLNSDGKTIDMNEAIATPFGFKLVGESESAVLFRAYNPILGNRTEIKFKNSPLALRLAPPLAVDNFEGITETHMKTKTQGENGARIIYIISDNNFSKKQRTLLYAFKLSP